MHHLRSHLVRTCRSGTFVNVANRIMRLGCCALQSRFPCCYLSVFNPDTIYALSSGHGKCGVAVIRISGIKAKNVLCQIGQFRELPKARMAKLRKLIDPTTKDPIDVGLTIWFPAPHSFTGEDSVEFQVHGGSAVVVALMSSLATIPGLRPAEAGEFTKRAFMNGKLDLTEVEGLGDLIHAETEAQRKQALRQMQGDLSMLYSDWRARLIQYTAMIEAFIDFSEDDNIEAEILEQVKEGVLNISKEIQSHLEDNRRGERLRNGVHVAIVGQPNVGKSSLLNSLCQRPAAIVSPVAGTTRDVIETAVNIGDFPVLLSDTAGLRESSDVIEKEGVRRALSRAKEADILILMLEAPTFADRLVQYKSLEDFISFHLLELGVADSSHPEDLDSHLNNTVNDDDGRRHLPQTVASSNYNSNTVIKSDIDLTNVIIVLNKTDLLEDKSKEPQFPGNHDNSLTVCTMSCVSRKGYQEFLDVLKKKVEKMCGDPLAGNPSLTQARHRIHLSKCLEKLELVWVYIEQEDVVLAAEVLRRALREVGRITGQITSEDILDVLFRDFCIGK